MRLLIIHISDVHITRETRSSDLGPKAIAQAVFNVEVSPNGILLCLTGDVANKGKPEEYERALDFVSELVGALKSTYASAETQPPNVWVSAVPGNHDCDLAQAGDLREGAIERVINQDPQFEPNGELSDYLVRVHKQFYDFAGAIIAPPWNTSSEGATQLIFREQLFACEGKSVCVLSVNSALTSMGGDREGRLFVPHTVVPALRPAADFVVYLQHHPFAWLHEKCRREVGQRIFNCADVVLSGHEHESSRRRIDDMEGVESLHFEGAVLLDHEEDHLPGFCAILVDMSNSITRHKHFKFTRSANTTEFVRESEPEWAELPIARSRDSERFTPTKEFEAFLDDVGLPSLDGNAEQMKLTDIYVDPKLSEVTVHPSLKGEPIDGQELIQFLEDHTSVAVFGDELSGKTSLCKILFRRLLAKKYVPVFIKSAATLRDSGDVTTVIEGQAVNCYGMQSLENYRRTDSTKRVLIIDDLHKLRIPVTSKAEVFKAFRASAGLVFVTCAGVLNEILELLNNDVGVADRRIRIERFLPSKRDALIIRWLQTKHGSEYQNVQDLVRRVSEVQKELDRLIGPGYLPSFPFYVLSLLQGMETVDVSRTAATSYAAAYDVFIKASLAKGATPAVLNIRSAYLQRLAHAIITKYSQSVSRPTALPVNEFEEFYRRYSAEYGHRATLGDGLELFVGRGILVVRDDHIAFKYPYLLYYFSALHMSKNRGVQEKGILEALLERIWSDTSANVLLFYSYFAGKDDLYERLMTDASLVFADEAPADMSVDPVPLQGGSLPDYRFLDTGNRESERHGVLKDMDGREEVSSTNMEQHEDLDPEKPFDKDVIIFRRSFRTIQCLGQLLRNHSGEFSIAQRQDIVATVSDACLRIFSLVMRAVEQEIDQYLRVIATHLREQFPEIEREELANKSNEAVSHLVLSISMGLLRFPSLCSGAKEYLDAFDKYGDGESTLSRQVITLITRIEHGESFPESKMEAVRKKSAELKLPKWLIYQMVDRYLRLFYLSAPDRMRICSKAGIKYETEQAKRAVSPKF